MIAQKQADTPGVRSWLEPGTFLLSGVPLSFGHFPFVLEQSSCLATFLKSRLTEVQGLNASLPLLLLFATHKAIRNNKPYLSLTTQALERAFPTPAPLHSLTNTILPPTTYDTHNHVDSNTQDLSTSTYVSSKRKTISAVPTTHHVRSRTHLPASEVRARPRETDDAQRRGCLR